MCSRSRRVHAAATSIAALDPLCAVTRSRWRALRYPDIVCSQRIARAERSLVTSRDASSSFVSPPEEDPLNDVIVMQC